MRGRALAHTTLFVRVVGSVHAQLHSVRVHAWRVYRARAHCRGSEFVRVDGRRAQAGAADGRPSTRIHTQCAHMHACRAARKVCRALSYTPYGRLPDAEAEAAYCAAFAAGARARARLCAPIFLSVACARACGARARARAMGTAAPTRCLACRKAHRLVEFSARTGAVPLFLPFAFSRPCNIVLLVHYDIGHLANTYIFYRILLS